MLQGPSLALLSGPNVTEMVPEMSEIFIQLAWLIVQVHSIKLTAMKVSNLK